MTSYNIFILTYNRAGKQDTYRLFKNLNMSDRVIFVCSDDDSSIDELKRLYPKNKVCVFNKQDAIKKHNIDTMFNNNSLKSVLFARYMVYDFAKKLGIEHFIMCDDDYTNIYGVKNDMTWRKLIHNSEGLDKAFKSIFKLLESSPYMLGLSIAQGGDFIGGINKKHLKVKRKCMNLFFCKTSTPMRFKGILNDDVNFYITQGARDYISIQIPFLKINQRMTQSNSGGLTDLYLENGTYLKSMSSILINPSAIRLILMGVSYKRIHHKINYNKLCPKILRESIKKNETTNS